MILRCSVVIAFLAALLGALAPAPARAQEATAVAGLGTPVTVYNVNVQPVGEVTVLDVTDPFEDFDPNASQPPRGYRWVKVSVHLKAGDQGMPSIGGFQVTDTSGYVSYQGYVYRSSEATTAEPDFQVYELAAGQEATGVIFFQVFRSESVATIEFVPTSGQLVVAADLRAAPVKQGEVVTYASTTDQPLQAVSVLGVVDPLNDFDPSYAPERGFRYVGVAISIQNLSEQPQQIDAYRFSVSDREGFTYTSAGVYRTQEGEQAFPSLTYGEIPPGGTVNGIVSFKLINGAFVKEVVFAPAGDRRMRIAEYAEGEAYVPPTMAEAPTPAPPTPEPSPTVESTPDPACAEALAWFDQAEVLLAPGEEAFAVVEQADEDQTVDPGTIRDSAESIRDLAGQLAEMDAPEIAQGARDQYVDILRRMADEMEVLAGTVEADDAAAKQASIDKIYAMLFEVASGAFADLATRCPDVMS